MRVLFEKRAQDEKKFHKKLSTHDQKNLQDRETPDGLLTESRRSRSGHGSRRASVL